jgi:hypothetical protein
MLFLTMGASPAALMAQTDAPQEEGEEIIVTGQPQRGSVIGNIKPEQQLSAADVRALGVTSISEMISELSAQTNGTPVVLLNGKRISSFSEIQDIPSEAVARVDILPEQVALSYGYAPTQKVANIVLRQRFRAELADLRAGTTTDGGRENGSAEAGLLRIRGDNRFTLKLKYSNAAALLERTEYRPADERSCFYRPNPFPHPESRDGKRVRQCDLCSCTWRSVDDGQWPRGIVGQ